MDDHSTHPPPDVSSLLLSWGSPSPWLLGLAVLLVAGYAAGVIALRRRGDAWPVHRTLTWLAGVTTLLLVTATGVGAYGMALLSVHMGQHMVLSMVTPILLHLGAPGTLAIRALPGRSRPRRALLRILHSRSLAVVAHPLVTSALFIASLYGLYFTSLLDQAMSSMLGHNLMLLHFLAVGLLFFGPVLAVDPWPRRTSPGFRLLQVLVAVPFHAFFGIAVMMASVPLSASFAATTAALGRDPLADQKVAGGIAWGFGEVPIVLVAGILFVQWVREDFRHARRLDRRADRDDDAALAAYNVGLARLHATPPAMTTAMTKAEAPVAPTATGVLVRRMGLADLEFAVAEHLTHFPDNVFGQMGERFLTEYYRTFLDGPHACGMVAEVDGTRAGFLVGIVDVTEHRRLVRRFHARRLAMYAASALARRPLVATALLRRRVSVTLARRRASRRDGPAAAQRIAVLSHVAVAAPARGVGAGTTLIAEFVAAARAADADKASLATRAGEDGAGDLYRRLGWVLVAERDTFDGRRIALYDLDLHKENA